MGKAKKLELSDDESQYRYAKLDGFDSTFSSLVTCGGLQGAAAALLIQPGVMAFFGSIYPVKMITQSRELAAQNGLY